MSRAAESKLVAFGDLPALSKKLHASNQRIVTTNGCFDLLHWGHIKYLEEARALGDILVCGLNSDASVKKLKGASRPLVAERVRALQVAGLESVDYVTVFEEQTPHRFIESIRPAIHVKGGDYKARDLPERECVEALGGKIVCLSLVEGFSTTQLIDQIVKKSKRIN